METIYSTIDQSQDQISSETTKQVTDVSVATQQLARIEQELSKIQKDSESFAPKTQLKKLLSSVMEIADDIATQNFGINGNYNLYGASTTRGVILRFRNPGNKVPPEFLELVKGTLKNAGIPSDTPVSEKIAISILENLNPELGAAKVKRGPQIFSKNSVATWYLAYGSFSLDDNGNQALVFACCIGEFSQF